MPCWDSETHHVALKSTITCDAAKNRQVGGVNVDVSTRHWSEQRGHGGKGNIKKVAPRKKDTLHINIQ